MDTLKEIQDWYAAQCNGVWEHGYGVAIETLDNPGWIVKIDLAGTTLSAAHFETVARGMDDDVEDWLHCKVAGEQFVGAGGPHILDEILRVFLNWAQAQTRA